MRCRTYIKTDGHHLLSFPARPSHFLGTMALDIIVFAHGPGYYSVCESKYLMDDFCNIFRSCSSLCTDLYLENGPIHHCTCSEDTSCFDLDYRTTCVGPTVKKPKQKQRGRGLFKATKIALSIVKHTFQWSQI